MGYAEDQFFHIPASEMLVDQVLGTTNPPFLYPGGTRKVLNARGKMVNKTVQRGFIRMLADQFNESSVSSTAVANMQDKRLFFQFNPATLSHQVQMRTDVYNPMIQDASQFTLPIPGNSSFYFTLTFDRQKEINRRSQIDATEGGTDQSIGNDVLNDGGVHDAIQGQSGTASVSGGAISADIMVNADPRDVGVLADLRVLGEIIGMGITEDMIDFIKAQGEIYNSYNTTEESDTPAWDEGAASTFLNANFGNQAFLFSNPIRIVFSSLFMIDGFITSINITHAKFNEQMVPVTCGVDLGVDVRYLGFAKTETFLTESLANAIPKPPDASSPAVTYNPTSPASTIDASKFSLVNFAVSAKEESDGFIETYYSWPYSNGCEVDYDIGSGSGLSAARKWTIGSAENDYTGRVGGPGALRNGNDTGMNLCQSLNTNKAENRDSVTVVALPNGSNDPVQQLFENGQLQSITFTSDIEIYRRASAAQVDMSVYANDKWSDSIFSNWPDEYYIPLGKWHSVIDISSLDLWNTGYLDDRNRYWNWNALDSDTDTGPNQPVINEFWWGTYGPHVTAAQTQNTSKNLFLPPALWSSGNTVLCAAQGRMRIDIVDFEGNGLTLTSSNMSLFGSVHSVSTPASTNGVVYMTGDDFPSFDFTGFYNASS